MGSAPERHTEGEGLPVVQERARELAAAFRSARTPVAPTRVRSAACRTGLPGARSTTPPSAEYLAARFEAGHSPAVAGQVVAAVRFYTKLGDQASPNRVGHRTGAGRVPA